MSNQPQTHQKPQEAKKPQPSFLTKEVLDTMEDLMGFNEYVDRPDYDTAHKTCVVTPMLFDIITKGLNPPCIHWKNIKVYCSETKDKVLENENKRTETVIVR